MAEIPPPPLLSLQGIAKRFGAKVALAGVELAVAAGEIHVICGENGAGKSTLMNILAGIHQPDEGTIALDGRPVTFASPLEAGRAGIGMVHQHFKLVPSMTVAENLYLGRQPLRFGLLTDRGAMRARASALIERYGFDLTPDAPVARLSVGQRQRVEILKALAFDTRLLILDEPTAVLTPPEVDALLAVLAGLKARGRTVLFITHKLREALAVADRITVVRQGRTVSTRAAGEATEVGIAHDMVGRAIRPARRELAAAPAARAEPVLRLEGLVMTAPGGRRLLDSVDLAVRAGEVVGIAGIDGNGQTELAEAIAGLQPLQAGSVRLAGTLLDGLSPRRRRAAGLAAIPEDRLDRGLSATMSIAENVAVSNYRAHGMVGRWGFVCVDRRRAFADRAIADFDIRGASPDLPVGQLSGGNMQKVVIARELARRPKALIAAQPTRGVDVGAMEAVHRRILAAAGGGCAVLLISSELSEVLALSDRIAVMHRGRIMAVMDRADVTEARIGLLMSGVEAEVG